MQQYWLFNCNKCITLMQDIGETCGEVQRGIWELSVFSAQYSYKFKTVLKINSI